MLWKSTLEENLRPLNKSIIKMEIAKIIEFPILKLLATKNINQFISRMLGLNCDAIFVESNLREEREMYGLFPIFVLGSVFVLILKVILIVSLLSFAVYVNQRIVALPLNVAFPKILRWKGGALERPS